MKVPFVNLGLQYQALKEDILKVFDVMSSSGNYVLNPQLKAFEEEFADYCGTKYAVGVANGTDALFLSLLALGIGNGDEVITAPNSFIASAGAIGTLGAKPVFVDVGEDYNIDPDKIEAAITSRTKALMPVHLTGRIADMGRILPIAQKHNLPIVEDAAQAAGAAYNGKRAGSFGITGCFSLHPLKNLHIHGDGGMITTNDSDLYDQFLKMRNHGLKNRDECEFWGYNSRLDGIQAASGSLKLPHLDKWNVRFREIAGRYTETLSGYAKVPSHCDHEQPVYHRYVIQHDRRDDLMQHLEEHGVETKINYPIPLHLQEPSRVSGYKEGDFPVAEAQATRILSLPLYPELEDAQVDHVISCVQSFPNP